MNKSLNESIILFGGNSEERLVSVASAQNVSTSIPEAELWFMAKDQAIYKISAEELASHQNPFLNEFKPKDAYTFSSLKDSLKNMKEKFVIFCLHGTEGEDGSLQKVLEDHQIQFTGSDSISSGLAFDKFLTKELAKKFGLPVAEDLVLKDFSEHNLLKLNSFFKTHKKLVLKPLANGSSVGLFIVQTENELNLALEAMKKNRIPYLAEPFISGREITVGVWEKTKGTTVALPCSEIRMIEGRQFDYEGKYLGKGVEEITPAPLSKEQTAECQAVALKLHELVGCKGYSRTDIILTDKGPCILEINTLPGLSKASFIPQQLTAMGTDLRSFFQAQLSLQVTLK